MANTNYPSANEPHNRPDVNRPNNNSKNIAIGVFAAALLGTWGYFLWDKNQSDEKITSYAGHRLTLLCLQEILFSYCIMSR